MWLDSLDICANLKGRTSNRLKDSAQRAVLSLPPFPGALGPQDPKGDRVCSFFLSPADSYRRSLREVGPESDLLLYRMRGTGMVRMVGTEPGRLALWGPSPGMQGLAVAARAGTVNALCGSPTSSWVSQRPAL